MIVQLFTIEMRSFSLISSSLRHKNSFLTKVRFVHSHYAGLLDNAIAKAYNPADHEDLVRNRWKNRERKDYSKVVDGGQVFRMVLPPPNVTGKLHLGHALTVAIQDSIMRWKIMTGLNVQWIPGFDHAGIATQSVVLRKINKSQSDGLKNSIDVPSVVEPTELLKQIKTFSESNRENISMQLDKMGTVLDWDSAYYTMNDNHSSIVEEAFISLFDVGLIRRGHGMVNWSCALQSSVADIECVAADFDGKMTLRVPGHKQLVEFGRLYFINYKLENSDESIQVATSRPETIFGDVAVAVNPDDTRYTKYVGCQVLNPLNGRLMPVVADSRVKIEFGSGALKLTPAHDKLDFKIGVDHKLDVLNILREDGHLNEHCGNLAGLGRFAARKAVLKRLTEARAVVDTKDYKGSVILCSRTGDVIEPRILPHWFFQTKWSTEKLISCIQSNELQIRPEYQKAILLHTLADAHDWCLSRQIKWGHPIPAYYHADYPDDWVAAFNKESARQKLEKKLSIEIPNDAQIRQDHDVLDTWFSSALIPLAVSGWPEITSKDFKELSLMETGGDILMFWVWRMAMLNLALIDKLPFRHVLLHGIVTDPYGRKMSKSRGNVIDPMHIINGQTFLEMIQETETSFKNGDLDQNEYKLRLAGLKKDYSKGFPVCGADALRFAILSQDICKQDLKLNTEYLENCKHFLNKLWQAMRFYFAHADKGINHPTEITKPDVKLTNSLADAWILACFHEFTCTMEQSIAACQFHDCTDAIRKFFYLEFCDVYIELIKQDLKEYLYCENHILTMRYIFGTGLKLIQPILPFISEEMWYHITENTSGLLMDEKYPRSDETIEFKNERLVQAMNKASKIVGEIRSLRNKIRLPKKSVAICYVEASPKDPILLEVVQAIETLTNCEVLLETPPRSEFSNLVNATVNFGSENTCRVSLLRENSEEDFMPIIDPDQIVKLKLKLAKLTEKLNNPAFLKFADDQSKENLKKKVETIKTKISEISQGSTSTEKS